MGGAGSAAGANGGTGGIGVAYATSGASVYYSGGGGGGKRVGTAGAAGVGGNGGGGGGSITAAGSDATPSTGGGGGGSAMPNGTTALKGGSGGSGIVIVRYALNSLDVTGCVRVQNPIASGTNIDMLRLSFDDNWGVRVNENYVGAGDIRYHTYAKFGGTEYNMLTYKGSCVGIGNTNPNAAYALDVGGSVHATGLATCDGGVVISNGASYGGVGRGIYMYSAGDTGFGIYMAGSGASQSLAGGTACASIDGRAAAHTRFRVTNGSTNGFIWENSGESCLMSLTADTGYLNVKGNVGIGKTASAAYALDVNGNVNLSGRVGVGKPPDGTLALDVSGVCRATDMYASSDARIKSEVRVIEGAMQKICRLRGVTFVKHRDANRTMGLIAQETREVAPEVVNEDPNTFLSINYGSLVGLLVEGLKEHQSEIDALKAKLDAFRDKVLKGVI